MKSEARRALTLSAALTLALSGLATYFAPEPLNAFAWPLIVAAAIALLVGYVPELLARAPRARTGPKLSAGLRLLSYEAIAWHATETPHAAEIRFRTRSRLQPARFRVVCQGTVHSATAVLEIMKDGQAIDGFSYYESTRVVQANVVVVEVSDRPIVPENQLYIQIRSSTPIHIIEVKKLRGKGALGEGFSPQDLSS